MRIVVASTRCLIRGEVHCRDTCARVRRDRVRRCVVSSARRKRGSTLRTGHGYGIEAALTEVPQQRLHLRRVLEPAYRVSACPNERSSLRTPQMTEIRPHITRIHACTSPLASPHEGSHAPHVDAFRSNRSISPMAGTYCTKVAVSLTQIKRTGQNLDSTGVSSAWPTACIGVRGCAVQTSRHSGEFGHTTHSGKVDTAIAVLCMHACMLCQCPRGAPWSCRRRRSDWCDRASLPDHPD